MVSYLGWVVSKAVDMVRPVRGPADNNGVVPQDNPGVEQEIEQTEPLTEEHMPSSLPVATEVVATSTIDGYVFFGCVVSALTLTGSCRVVL